MRKSAFTLLLMFAGCSWSNSLYQARRLSESAAKAEREERRFDAGSLWGQVAVKAESVYVRDPDGDTAAEALWLRGRAMAHLGGCAEAGPLLERAFILDQDPEWVEELILETARCSSLALETDAAIALVEPLFQSPNSALGREARLIAGRALARAGRWSDAAGHLANDETELGRWQYAVALANTGRADSALAVIAPRILAQDLTADWESLLRAMASDDVAVADRLIESLMKFPRQSDTSRARFLLATTQGLQVGDSVERNRRIEEILALGPTPSSPAARLRVVDRITAGVTDPESLREAIATLEEMMNSNRSVRLVARGFMRWGNAVLVDVDELANGTPEGDLAMWFHADIARDTLNSTQLSDWFLRQLEIGWPDSPYVPKALLGRIALDVDSTDAIRARLESFLSSEYLAYLGGRETAKFASLEDSLDLYLGNRFAVEMMKLSDDGDAVDEAGVF